MQFFSPLFLRRCELDFIKLALNRRVSPINTSVSYHGLVTFVPVRVQELSNGTFTPHFIGSIAPILDVGALRGCEFPYAYGRDGAFNQAALSGPKITISTTYDICMIGDITVSDTVRNGDILLACRQYPARKEWMTGTAKEAALC